jgi:hypothetical protein
MNEAQMILHDHPVNARRAARGLPPANSVWLWGFGVAGAVTGRTDDLLLTDDDWLAGLWSLHGGRTGAPAAFAASPAGESATLRVGIAVPPGGDGATRLQSLEQGVLVRLRSGLEQGIVDAAAVHAGSVVLELDRRARWRFWRRPQALGEVGT